MIGHRFAISYLLRWFRTLPWNVFICFLIELSSTFLAMQCNAKQTLHRLVILRFFPITSLLACSPWGFLFFASSIGKASKKTRIFYGQADRKRLPHPPSKGQLFMNFLVRFYFRVWLYVFWNGFYFIIKCVSLFTFYRFQAIKCARRQPSTFYGIEISKK